MSLNRHRWPFNLRLKWKALHLASLGLKSRDKAAIMEVKQYNTPFPIIDPSLYFEARLSTKSLI